METIPRGPLYSYKKQAQALSEPGRADLEQGIILSLSDLVLTRSKTSCQAKKFPRHFGLPNEPDRPYVPGILLLPPRLGLHLPNEEDDIGSMVPWPNGTQK